MATPESSGLDRLICDLEFENNEYIKEIKQEELKRKDFKNRIEEIKLKTEHDEEKTPCLDAGTKQLHSQFTQNREHVQNYKKTLALSNEHTEALKKKLSLVTEKMIRERKEHEDILKHYRDIQEDYKAVYENLKLTKVLNSALQNRAHAEEMWRECNNKAEELRSHIRQLTNTDVFTPYVDINSFINKLAEIQIETLTTERKVKEKVAEELSLRPELKRLQMEEKKEEERKQEEEIKKELELQRAKELKQQEQERKRLQSEEQMAIQKTQAACQDQSRVITVSVTQPEQQSISATNLVKENYKPQRMDVSRTFQQRTPITPHASTSSRLIFPNIPVTSISERQGSRYPQLRFPASQPTQFTAKTTSLTREVHDRETQKIVSWPSLKQPFKPSVFMQQAELSQSSPIPATISRITGGDVCRNPLAPVNSPAKPVQAHPNSGGRLQMPSQCTSVLKVPPKRFSVPLPVALQTSPKRPIRADALPTSAPAVCPPSTKTSPPISHRDPMSKLPQTPFHRELEQHRFSKDANTVSPAQDSPIDMPKTQEEPNEMLCSTPEQQKTRTDEPVESPYDLEKILSKVTAPKSPADSFVESSRAMFTCDESYAEQQKGSSSCAEFQENLFFHSMFGSGDAMNCKSKDATPTSYDAGSLPTTEFNFGDTGGDAGPMNMETNIFGMFGSDADDKSSDGNSQPNSFSFNFGGGDAAPNTSTFSFF